MTAPAYRNHISPMQGEWVEHLRRESAKAASRAAIEARLMAELLARETETPVPPRLPADTRGELPRFLNIRDGVERPGVFPSWRAAWLVLIGAAGGRYLGWLGLRAVLGL